MPRTIPSLLGLALSSILTSNGWTQKDLAAAHGLASSMISEYISGDRELTLERLEELLAPLGVGADRIEQGVAAAALLCPEPPEPATPVDPTPEERRIIDRATARVQKFVGADFKARWIAKIRKANAAADREAADALWRRLKAFPAEERPRQVEQTPDFHTWALAERLCAESEEMAPASAPLSLELAELARCAARHARVPEPWQPGLEGYTVAFIANAHRVSGHLRKADAAFAEALRLCTPGSLPWLLDAGRMLDLEASLRRAQRRFEEALVLHERALAVCPPEQVGHNLLNQSATLEQMGGYPASIKVLEKAATLVDGTRQPRLLCVLRFNLAVNLCHLERPKEAEPILDEVRILARAMKKESDLFRLRWLEGKVAAGLGRPEEAIPSLEQVRQWFAAKNNPYDTALATLELAALYLDAGHNAKVKELVREMAPIFAAQDVHREALAALALFRDAALQETATAALARRLVRYLTEARHDPERRFEG
jgi:tetratricopeptide (TPR) repeat protein